MALFCFSGEVDDFTGTLKMHLPGLKCPETTKMQPKHNAVRHVLRWATFIAHYSLVGVIRLRLQNVSGHSTTQR